MMEVEPLNKKYMLLLEDMRNWQQNETRIMEGLKTRQSLGVRDYLYYLYTVITVRPWVNYKMIMMTVFL